MSSSDDTTEDAALSAVAEALRDFSAHRGQPGLAGWETQEMPGGASTRRFFRAQAAAGPSLVAMYVPSPSQEIAKARQAVGVSSFLEVQKLLETTGVRVPSLHHDAGHKQVLLVEDLGDDTLAHYLTHSEHHRAHLYNSAVTDLARAQHLLRELPNDCIVRERAFDADLLRWEVEHFREWALAARGIELNDEQRAIFDRAAEHLSSTIASWPRGFVHRDYQSRNLMVRRTAAPDRPELVWIDFQDAMLGPRVYDLVALLTDSYQTFSREFIEQRLAEYCEAGGIATEFERVLYEFDFVTVQRKLKDAGRFVFLERVNKNPHFLGFVEPTIAKARAALGRVKTPGPLQDLDDLLARLFD